MNIELLTIKAKEKLNAGASQDEILSFLRASGCSKTQSIFIIANLLACSMKDAKLKIHFSKVWADTKASDEEFHNGINETLRGQQDV